MSVVTKKILVPVDINNYNKKNNGFLYPGLNEKGEATFLDISSGKEWSHGMIAFTGRELNKNVLFAKIVDSGKKIDSVSELVSQLDNYLAQIKTFKIGNIVAVNVSDNGQDFDLIKVEKPKR